VDGARLMLEWSIVAAITAGLLFTFRPRQSVSVKPEHQKGEEQKESSASVPDATVASREAATPASILIIDDEAAIRESLATLLEMEGYEVESAETGEQGLARLGDRPFDLVLLEFALPDRNGAEVLRDIRDRDPQLSVIMITAYGTVENAVTAMQAGATNFIQKPWDNEKLLADVRAAVARRWA